MSSKRPVAKTLLVVFTAAVAISLLSLYPGPTQVASAARDTYESLQTFSDIIAIVRKNYVEELETKDLVEAAIRGMVSSLDPHSAYLSPSEYKELQIDTHGEFGGLGIEITLRDKILTIVTPIDGTPAFRAGVHPGDQIIKIDGELTKDLTLQDSVDRMRGKPGTSVTLSLWREGADALIDVTIVREIIHVNSVKRRQLLEGRYGYIRLVTFQDGSASELASGLQELREEAGGELDGVILDLRYNPGGLLQQAVRVSGLFLDAGLIVSTNGRVEGQNHKFFAQAEGTEPLIPTIVMVNKGSASASEIVAGALQDHKRALVVGSTSFGKGSVQTVLPLEGGRALRLTTARYYTPSGRSIADKGITPDLEVEQEPLATVLASGAEEDSDGKGGERQDAVDGGAADHDAGKPGADGDDGKKGGGASKAVDDGGAAEGTGGAAAGKDAAVEGAGGGTQDGGRESDSEDSEGGATAEPGLRSPHSMVDPEKDAQLRAALELLDGWHGDIEQVGATGGFDLAAAKAAHGITEDTDLAKANGGGSVHAAHDSD